MRDDCRCWIEVRTANIAENLRRIRRRAGGAAALAVIKNNAYGIGVREVARALADSGEAARFGVASLAEAIEIADLGVPVQIISGILPAEIPEAVERDFILPVNSVESARLISAEAVRRNRTPHVEIKTDVGMGRVGIRYETFDAEFAEIAKLPRLGIGGIFAHLPASGEAGDPETAAEIARLKAIIARWEARGFRFGNRHIAASGGICNYPEATAAPFNMIRPGIILHGFDATGGLEVLPGTEFKARIIAIRELPAGATLGYNRTCRLERPERIAVVAAGYADGVPVALTNRGVFLAGGYPAPVAGRVSMDYTMVRLDPAAEVRVGDEAVLFGEARGRRAPMEEWARIKNVPSQDILCSLGHRPERVYL